VAGAGSGVNSKAVPPNAMLEDASWFGDMWNPAHMQGTGGLTFCVSFALVGLNCPPRSDAFNSHTFGVCKCSLECIHICVSSICTWHVQVQL
jgi:hypothetical protein